MRLAVRALSAACLAALLALPLLADEKKKEEKKKPPPKDAHAAVFNFPKVAQIKLDDKQLEKMAELRRDYTPKLDELALKRAKIIPRERELAANAARKEAAAAKKTKKEQEEAYSTALKLTEDEQAQMKEINAERRKVVREINEKKMALLTEEQKEQLKKKPEPKKEPKKPETKPKDKKEPEKK